MLRWYAFLTSSSLTTSLIRFQRSGWSSHWWALSATWVPSGFVSTSTSPTTALSGMMNSFGWQMVVPTPPMVHQGFITVWPPVTVVPASRAQSLNPLIIKGMTTSRSFSVILVDTAKSINMLSHSVTPMAYKSLKTLAQAIFPCMYGSSTKV